MKVVGTLTRESDSADAFGPTLTAGSLAGRGANSGSGVAEEISVGPGLRMSSTTDQICAEVNMGRAFALRLGAFLC